MIALLIAIALFIGVIGHLVVPSDIRADNSDYRTFYKPVAESILAGKGTTLQDQAAVRYPPGFPLLIAGALGVTRMVSISDTYGETGLSLLAFAVSSVLLFVIAELIHGTEWALVSYGLWICCPWALYLTSKPLSDIPFCCLLFAVFYLLCRAVQRHQLDNTRALLVGLLVGSSMLIRPIGLLLGPIVVAFVWLFAGIDPLRRRIASGLLIIVGTTIPVLPWETYVYVRSHRIILLSTGSIPSIRDGLVFASNGHLKRYRNEISAPARAQQVSLDVSKSYSILTSDRAVLQFLLSEVRQNPVGVLELYALKAGRSWYGSDAQQQDSRVLVIQTVLLPILLVGALGTWSLGGYYRRYAIMSLLLVLYFWAMTILALSILRYMVPAIGLLLVLVPGWRTYLYGRARSPEGAVVQPTNVPSGLLTSNARLRDIDLYNGHNHQSVETEGVSS